MRSPVTSAFALGGEVYSTLHPGRLWVTGEPGGTGAAWPVTPDSEEVSVAWFLTPGCFLNPNFPPKSRRWEDRLWGTLCCNRVLQAAKPGEKS